MRLSIILITMFVFPLLGKEKLPIIETKIINNKKTIKNNKADLLSFRSCLFFLEELDLIKSSSSLGKKYSAENVADPYLSTAWIEGKKDYGVGEYIEIKQTRRLSIPDTILNGYHKSEKLFKANSRVKLFKVYIDNTPCCYLKLKDSMKLQRFELPKKGSIGSTYKFEIKDVYKGEKYKDTAISGLMSSTYLKEKKEKCHISRVEPWGCCNPKTFRDSKIKGKFRCTSMSKAEAEISSNNGLFGRCRVFQQKKLIIYKEDNGSCVDSSCADTYFDKNMIYVFPTDGQHKCYRRLRNNISDNKNRDCTKEEYIKYRKLLDFKY